MANYSASPVPSQIVKTLFDNNWDTKEGILPKPSFIDVNEALDRRARADIRQADQIIIRVDTPAEEETPIGNWTYGNRIVRVLLEIYTNTNRQRLFDLQAEIRRICHAFRHTTPNYQRIQYKTFNELTQENINIWTGRVIIELVNSAVLLET